MRLLLIALSLVSLTNTALAQGGPPPLKGWQVDVGVGAIAGPRYLGTKDYRIQPIPFIDVRYGERYFANVPQGVGAWLVNERSGAWRWRASAAIAPNFTARDRDDIPGLSRINIAVEGRGFFELSHGKTSVSLTLSQDLGTGHDGFYGDLEFGYGDRIGQRGFGRISAGLRYADTTYMNSFYTINDADSLASGLATFDAGGGFESAGVSMLYAHTLSRRWRATVLVNGRLALSDARSSPISDTNVGLTLISALTYRF